MTTGRCAAYISALILGLGAAGCITFGSDDLSSLVSGEPPPDGETSGGDTASQAESAEVTSAPGNTDVSTTAPPTESLVETTEDPETNTCAGGCGTSETSGDESSTCGFSGCEESTTTGTETTGETVDCAGGCRNVFVTLGVFPGDFGGTSVADAACAADATLKGLPGVYRAWLSQGPDTPLSLFETTFTGFYVLAGSTTAVAHGWEDLVDGSLEHPINVDASGVEITVALGVWTGTAPNGALDSTCGAMWTDTTMMATAGMLDRQDEGWTASGTLGCAMELRLYCIEEP